MKKYIISILMSAVMLSGCTLDREPLTGPSTGSFPASFEEAQAGVLAAYKSLANNQHNYNPADRWYDQITDIGAIRTTLSGWPNFILSAIVSNNSNVCDTYARIYKGLGRIHLVLDNLDDLRGVISDEDYYCFKAELLCLRAYQYDTACKFFGAVPWVDHCLTLEDYAYARTPREEIIERIISDMDDALLDKLPIAWDKTEWGTCRLGRVAAYALKARICLEWGYFDDAAKYSKKALDLSAGIYDLTPLNCTYYATHADGEPDQTPLFGFDAEKNSQEWIWAIQFDRLAASNVHAGIYARAPRTHNGASTQGPSQAMMDTFQMKNGKKITDEGSGYNWQDPWANRDPRLDLYCLRSGARCMGLQFSVDPNDKTVWDYNANKAILNADANKAVNKYEYGANGEKGPGGYLWRKFTDPVYYGAIPSKEYEDELDMPIIRLAELLLIDAEANIEMEGGDLTRAKANIDRVRARVNMPGVGSSREELRSALRYERKVELCCEGFRWFDIRRWKDAEGRPLAYKALNNVQQIAPAFGKLLCNAKPYIDENWIVTYEPFTFETTIDKDGKEVVKTIPHKVTFDGKDCNARIHTTTKFILNKDELWPFPYDEMVTNPLIGLGNNNPGY